MEKETEYVNTAAQVVMTIVVVYSACMAWIRRRRKDEDEDAEDDDSEGTGR